MNGRLIAEKRRQQNKHGLVPRTRNYYFNFRRTFTFHQRDTAYRAQYWRVIPRRLNQRNRGQQNIHFRVVTMTIRDSVLPREKKNSVQS